MAERGDNKISRKNFFKKSYAGLLSYGLLKESPVVSLNRQKSSRKTSSEYRLLGRTGIKVIPVGFGASRTMEPRIVKAVLDKGLNFFDTGRAYYNGQNEVMLGKVLKGIRKEIIIQSKMQIRIREKGEELKSAAVSNKIRNVMQRSLDASLKALQTDYIDIMLIHGASEVDIINNETIIEFFKKIKEKGIIKSFGFSSHNNQVELLKAANRNNYYDVIMVPYNHKGSYIHMLSGSYSEWDQSALEVELKKAHRNNVGLVAMKTCSGGPCSLDGESKPSYKSALKWISNHDYIHTMVPAMGNMQEIDENA